jgi:hypothetical protein
MTGVTATQNLPYPTSGDRVVDQWSHQRNLANALEDRFNAHASDLLRAQNVPLVVLEQTIQRDYPTSGFSPGDELVSFDTVLVDTAGMVDLTVNSKNVPILQNGYWRAGGYLHVVNGLACSAGTGTLFLAIGSTNASGSTDTNQAHDGVVGEAECHVESEIRVSGNNSTVFMFPSTTGTTCPNFISVDYARFYLFWMRDL